MWRKEYVRVNVGGYASCANHPSSRWQAITKENIVGYFDEFEDHDLKTLNLAYSNLWFFPLLYSMMIRWQIEGRSNSIQIRSHPRQYSRLRKKLFKLLGHDQQIMWKMQDSQQWNIKKKQSSRYLKGATRPYNWSPGLAYNFLCSFPKNEKVFKNLERASL